MTPEFVYSDEPCCMRCSYLRFDMDRMTDYCKRDGHAVKQYYKACEHFNEILGRFGGWTAPEKEEPKQQQPLQLTLF